MPVAATSLYEVDKQAGSRKPISLRVDDKGRRGASGTVFEHSNASDKAIKIYHEKERSKFEEKIRTMIKVRYNRPHTAHFDLAWPESIIVDGVGGFLGFKMPFFGPGWVDLESLMQASEAEQRYQVGERERLAIGANLSMALKELHALGVHAIDLKPQNIRINLQTYSVGIIDCDGMSVLDIGAPNGKRYHADKSTPEFWAPENIGLKPETFKDGEAHDRFALATIIFMLLNRGIHPYQGVMSFDISGAETTAGKIKHNLYPYGAGKGRITPHPDSVYPYWPAEAKSLFDLAFSTVTTRPSAEEWLSYLGRLSSEVEACNNNPKYHLRYPSVGCPVCERDAASPPLKPPVYQPPIFAPPPAHTQPPTFAQPPAHTQSTPPSWVLAPPPSTPPVVRPVVRQPPQPPLLKWLFSGSAVIAVVLLVMYLGPAFSPAPPPSCAEQSVYSSAVRGGKAALRGYLRECAPRGAFVQQATDALETIVYDEASACIRSSCSTAPCLKLYTDDSASGPRLVNLRSQEDTRKNSEQCNPAVAEQNAWSRAVNGGTIFSFQQYLNQYPNGPHAADARQRIANLQGQADNDAWSGALRAGTISAFQQYLRDFPNGLHAADARQRIASLQQQADDIAWAQANQTVNLSALKQHLIDFPNCRHVVDAQRRIDLIQSVISQFNIQPNLEIRSNSPFNTQVFTGARIAGSGVMLCGNACLQTPGCRAFTSDDYSCRLYRSPAVQTAPSRGWTSGLR